MVTVGNSSVTPTILTGMDDWPCLIQKLSFRLRPPPPTAGIGRFTGGMCTPRCWPVNRSTHEKASPADPDRAAAGPVLAASWTPALISIDLQRPFPSKPSARTPSSGREGPKAVKSSRYTLPAGTVANELVVRKIAVSAHPVSDLSIRSDNSPAKNCQSSVPPSP